MGSWSWEAMAQSPAYMTALLMGPSAQTLGLGGERRAGIHRTLVYLDL